MAEDPLSDSEACRLPIFTVPSSVTAQLREDSRERCVCQTLNLAAVTFTAGDHTQPGSSVHRKAFTGESAQRETPPHSLISSLQCVDCECMTIYSLV